MAKLIGTDPNQVPTNADLGTMAYLDYNTLKPQLLAGGNRNLIINGAMRVAQRGTSSTSNGFQTVDRFKNGTQTIGITQSQESITSGAPFEEGFLNYYRQTVTTPSSASNVIAEIKHSIEAQDIAGSGWNFKSASKSLTLSFYVRSSVSGTYYSYIRSTDASPEQFYRFSFVLSANIWTKVEKTIAGNSNLVFPNDNGEGLAIFWVPAFGTSYTGSSVNLDQWETLSGTDYIPDVTHAWGNTSGATFDLTGVQLEVGDTATPFEHRSYGDELARCQRYYYQSPDNNNFAYNGAVSGVNTIMTFQFKQTMRTTPSVTLSLGSPTDINRDGFFLSSATRTAVTIQAVDAEL
jgi:hypothetical protein